MNSRIAWLCLAGLALMVLAVPGLSPAGQPPQTPTAEAKPDAADLCQGAIDPYDAGAERMRFFQAAGVDNELDAKEFQAAQGKDGSFVRPYDRWSVLLLFDKNKNGTVDWFEADAYRQDVRKRVLATFDTNKDGSLKDKERLSANQSLAKGIVPGRPGAGYAAPDAHLPPAPPSPYYMPDYTSLMKKFDSDGDGRLTTEEWQALNKQVQADREKWQLDRYDKNKDGALDEAEKKAMNDDLMAWSREMARRAELIAWDKNKDGKLDQTEQAALDEYKERIRRQAEEGRRKYEEMIKKHDADGDGKLNDEERKAMYEDYRQQAEIQQWDKNKDGQLDDQERAEMEKEKARWKRIAELQRQYYVRKYDKDGDGVVSGKEWMALSEEYQRKMIERWDADGDGKLSNEERQAMYDAMRDRYAKMRKLMDTDGDGQTSAEEMRDYNNRNLKKYDTNKDGWLDPEETEKMNDDLDKEEEEEEEE